MHHIIFDMDGVLSDSWDNSIEGLIPTGYHGNTREEVLKSHMEYCIRRPIHARNGLMTPERKTWISKTLDTLSDFLNSANTPLFDEFIQEIQYIDGIFGLVSAGGGKYVYKQAQKTGLPFTHVLAWEDGPSKEEKIEMICRDWEIPVTEVIYVTDTLADVYELETMMPRKHIIGCAWGFCGYAILREELPKEQILRKPEDIHDVISKMQTQKSNNK
jgi:phosphoglycolate phosphatase-like HAD superfamily hydrolase